MALEAKIGVFASRPSFSSVTVKLRSKHIKMSRITNLFVYKNVLKQ